MLKEKWRRFSGLCKRSYKLEVLSYDTFVSDGHSDYRGINNFIQSDAKYQMLDISNSCNVEKFKEYLKMHQQGQTDYHTFCKHAAETGVEKWTVDMTEMTCCYYE
jgi:uncharacterized protein YbcV (DUF1398 family)